MPTGGQPYVTINGQRMGLEEARRKHSPNAFQQALLALNRLNRGVTSHGRTIGTGINARNKAFAAAQKELGR